MPADGIRYLKQLGDELGVSAARDEFQKTGADNVLRGAQRFHFVWSQLRAAALALVATGVVKRSDAEAVLSELLEPGARAMAQAGARTAGVPEVPVDFSRVSFLDEDPFSGHRGSYPPV